MATDGSQRPMLRLIDAGRGPHATTLRAGNTPAPARRATPGRMAPAEPEQAPAPFDFPGLTGRRPAVPRGPARPFLAAYQDGPVRVGTSGSNRVGRRARQDVAAENHSAAAHDFDPADPRWVLAIRAAGAIEGGRAAILAPEQRARLVALGTHLGLRTFDAHLVLAIVQDAARTGREVVEPETRGRLAMLPPPRPPAPQEAAIGFGLRLATAALLAFALVGVAIGWIGG